MASLLSSFDSQRRKAWLYVAGLTALTIVSRLPRLFSPNLLLDGDESLVGLMAKHVAGGEGLPIFVYGQQYGLATIETAVGALWFQLFGVSPIPLKLAILLLWHIGVVFLFLALSRGVGAKRAFWIVAVFLLTPAWASAAMKAWGGYTTAFTASAVLVWLLARGDRGMTGPQWLIAGVLTAVTYLARPLWLPVVLPFVLAAFAARVRWRWGAGYVAATLGVLVAVKFATADTAVVWEAPPFWNPALLKSLPGGARQIYINLTGAYFLGAARDVPGPVTELLARVWYVALPSLALIQIYRLATKRYYLLSHLLFLSVCATLVVPWVMLFARDPRYLLPLCAPLVVLAAVELLDLVDRRVVSSRVLGGLTAAVLLLGSISMFEFRSFDHLWANPPHAMSEAERMRQIVDYLKTRNVSHVYSMNGLLNFQVMFYSNERVLSRSKGWRVRYPPYARKVDRALATDRPVAVVGYTDHSGAPGCWDVPICTGGIAGRVPDPETIFTVDDKYFVYVGADKELLRQLGFRIAD